jgi:hypothetical protein
MCSPHHERWEQIHRVAKGYLDPELWRSTLRSFVEDDLSFDHIIFQWLGDPSLHPALPTLIADAASTLQQRVNYLRLDTNGILLTPPRIDAILSMCASQPDAPPLLVVFTIDAHTPPTYAAVKGQDALMRVRRHVRYLIRLRRQLGARCRVNLQLQFVIQPGNAQDAGEFLRYWSDLLSCQGGKDWHDEIMFKRLSVGGGAVGQAAADRLYERTIQQAGIRPGHQGAATVLVWERRPWQNDDAHTGTRTACPGLWLTPVIRHDGALMMCCADLGGELALGSLRESSFRELWWGPRATQHRLAHLDGRFEGVCASCGGINWYALPDGAANDTQRRGAELGLTAPGLRTG